MDYLLKYLQNLLLFGLVIGGSYLFAQYFYPETLEVVSAMGEMVTAFNFWPIVVVTVLVAALPRRQRR